MLVSEVINRCLERSWAKLGIGKFFHIMEPRLEYWSVIAPWQEFKVFIFNGLRTCRFGLLHAFNQLELLFIRPQRSNRLAVLR
jgi:hypothetical protein